MNIASNWKLTYDPTGTPAVLLNYGDELLEEPELALRRGLEVVPIEGAVPLLRPTLADQYEASLGVIFKSSTDALARHDMLNAFTNRYDGTTVIPLRLEVTGLTTARFDWASAFIHSVSVRRHVDDSTDGSAAWLLRISFTAVALTKTIL